MGFGTAVKTCFSKYVTFGGRAPRSELWWFFLFNVIALIVAGLLDSLLGTTYTMSAPNGATARPGYGYIYTLYSLAILLPSISVAVRRLHDIARSGWWYWLVLIPLVGGIWLLVWFCLRGTAGENRFGRDPLAASASAGPTATQPT